MASRCKVTLYTRIERSGAAEWEPGVPGVNRYFEFSGTHSSDPSQENKLFQKASPSIDFKLGVANPNIDFEIGRDYYLDIVRAPRAGEPSE
jgi:hypothetical protein